MYNIKLIYLIILSIPILVQTLFGLTFLSVLLVEFCTKQNTRHKDFGFTVKNCQKFCKRILESYPLDCIAMILQKIIRLGNN